MGGRGSSSRIGGKNFDAPLNESKVGSTYKSLPKAFQDNIKNNLKISPEMKRDIENGRRNKMTDEWTTGLSGSRTKMKVVTDVSSNGTVTYTDRKSSLYEKEFKGTYKAKFKQPKDWE